MKLLKRSILSGALLLALSTAQVVFAQTINFSAGQADWTFFYDWNTEEFDVVFRDKGNTTATGMTSPYGNPAFAGQVGGSSDDYNYSTLNVIAGTTQANVINSTTYYFTPASGTSYSDSFATPDVGLRTRFRDGPDAVDNLFDSFTLTLNWAASTKPVGAEFVLARLGHGVFIETAADDFAFDPGVWGHLHYNFGFSQPGEYTLVFDLLGSGGDFGPATGTTEINFSVVPEPQTYAAVLGLIAIGVLFIHRRRRA